jgi:asparagine synthetase A
MTFEEADRLRPGDVLFHEKLQKTALFVEMQSYRPQDLFVRTFESAYIDVWHTLHVRLLV